MPCAFRKWSNERAADTDLVGFHCATAFRFCLVFCKTWWRDGQLDLALRHGSAVILLQLAALLNKHRRQLYVRFREPILALLLAHGAWGVLSLSIHAVPGMFAEHSHNPLLLLISLALGNSAIYLCLVNIYLRPLLCWNLLALPLVALMALSTGGNLCDKALAAPGTEAQLTRLYGVLETTHAAAHPFALFALVNAPGLRGKCLAVNAWSLMLLGVLLPLYVTYRLELPARKLFYCSRVGQIEGQPASSTAAQQEAALSPLPALLQWFFLPQPAVTMEAGQESGIAEVIPAPHWLNFYLTSCLVWTVVCALQCGTAALAIRGIGSVRD